MSILNFATFAGGKNLAINLFDKSSSDVIQSGDSKMSQFLALSFNENGNNRIQITSSLTPVIFHCITHFQKVKDMSIRVLMWEPVELDSLQ